MVLRPRRFQRRLGTIQHLVGRRSQHRGRLTDHLLGVIEVNSYAPAVTRDDFDRVPLLFGPSPIHPLRRLSVPLGDGVEIWAKREVCNSAYGSTPGLG
jgi:hypothetical protein